MKKTANQKSIITIMLFVFSWMFVFSFASLLMAEAPVLTSDAEKGKECKTSCQQSKECSTETNDVDCETTKCCKKDDCQSDCKKKDCKKSDCAKTSCKKTNATSCKNEKKPECKKTTE